MEITIKLNDEDLNHFQREMHQAIERNADLSAAEICAHAASLLERVRASRVPDFVADRMRHLVSLIAMVQDEAWNLDKDDRQRVLGALSYFAEPHDDIPDSVPVFGFLDDAIMIELLLRELKHELEAYEEFCVDRRVAEAAPGAGVGAFKREGWLAQRREELMDRMRRRRANQSPSYVGTKPFSLFKMR